MAGVKNRRSVDGRPNRLVERLEAGQVITAVDQVWHNILTESVEPLPLFSCFTILAYIGKKL